MYMCFHCIKQYFRTMDARMLIVLLAVGVCCISVGAGELLANKLKKSLLFEYDPETIPMVDPTNDDPVNVSIGMEVTGIADFSNNVLALDVWLAFQWNDFRLTWDSSKWKDLSTIYIPAKKLWIPDVVLYNSAMGDSREDKRGLTAVAHSDGSITFVPAKRVKAYCKNTVETYNSRSGQYTCDLKFGSWVYNGAMLNALNRSSEVGLYDMYPSNQWEITSTSVSRNVVVYACCPEPYIDVTFSLTLREKLSYHP